MRRVSKPRTSTLDPNRHEIRHGSGRDGVRGSSLSPKPQSDLQSGPCDRESSWGNTWNPDPSWLGLHPKPIPVLRESNFSPPRQDDASELSSQARHVKELLICQQAQVRLLKSATDNAAHLSSHAPRRPGFGQVSALRGIAAALSCSVECALDLAGRFVKDVQGSERTDGVKVGEVREAAETPRGANGFNKMPATDGKPVVWGSQCWSPPSGYGNPCWSGSCVIPLSYEDPFVDAPPAETQRESPVEPIAFAYHPDQTPSCLDAGSRRVVLDDLSPSIGVTQVLRAIRCYGGVMAATVVPGCASGGTTRSAVIEFVYPVSAAGFVDDLKGGSLAFAAEDDSVCGARAWLVPTASFAYTARDRSLLNRGVTRAVAIRGFPADAIWNLLVRVGTHAITEALPDRGPHGDLVLEFRSLFEADRARNLIDREWLVHQSSTSAADIHFDRDSSQGTPFQKSVTGHVSATHLEDKWNRASYNERTVAHYREALNEARQQDEPIHTPPGLTEKLAECHDVSPSQLLSHLAEREHFPDTEYRVLGSTITLTRRAWSWRVCADDDVKLLMANTLHEPEWADEWDQHFAASGAVNLRTWERYGMLARHRRDKAVEQGIEDWRVPRCDAKCEWGCCDIRAVSLPGVVRQYLEESSRRPTAASNAGSQ